MRALRCLLLLLGMGFAAAPGAVSAGPFEIAHRGASGYLPEHTLAAAAMAHALGAEFIEQDVVISSDGIPVVLHDVTLDATTDVADRFPGRARDDGKHYVVDFTLAELKSLEVRERFDPETGEPVFAGRYAGEGPVFRIATLDESLALVGGLNRSTGREAGVYPEIKSAAWHLAQGVDLSAAVLEVLARHGYGGKESLCYLQCFEYDEVKRLRDELGYRGRLVQLLSGGDKVDKGNTDNAFLRTPAGLRELARRVDGIGPPIGEIVGGDSPESRAIKPLVADAHAAGLEVHPYTLRADSLPRWASGYDDLVAVLAEAGIDGYFTDFPGLAK